MKSKLLLIALVLLSVLPTLDLLQPGLPITHDGQDHVARIANFYASLSEGNIVPRWAANLNWGYGHPVLMFLYPLPSYVASLFHFFGFTFVDSTKLVFALSFVASVLAMYLWLRAQWGSPAGFVGAVLYGFAPYRFVDFTLRGAIGEHVAFVFPPLIFWSLFLLAKDGKRVMRYISVLSLSSAGLILSHNAISLMFFPLVVLYLLHLTVFAVSRKERRIFFLRGIGAIGLGFLLSAFFWVPAFFEGKYTLRDIVTKGDFAGRFVPWSWFLYSPWNYGGGNQFTKELGRGQIIAIISALFILKRSKERQLIIGSLIVFILAVFMMTDWSGWIWNSLTLIQKFQFPWRFLSLTTFLSALFGAIVVASVPKKYTWLLGGFLIILSLATSIPMWKAKGYSIKPESFYGGVYYGTTDTGESSPIWSVRFMERTPASAIEVIEGAAKITSFKRTTTEHTYAVEADKQTRLVDNTLYFPGWIVTIDGRQVPVEFQDPSYRGLMTFWVNPGSHQIVVRFADTKLRTFANSLSLGAVFFFITTIVVLRKKTYATIPRTR